MKDSKQKTIEAYRARRSVRLDSLNEDGGDGSGNWGHVGRPGIRGGSEPGGGLGFRLEKSRTPSTVGQEAKGNAHGGWKDKKGKEKMSRYVSQALIRRNIQRDLKSNNFQTYEGAKHRQELTEMRQKTAHTKQSLIATRGQAWFNKHGQNWLNSHRTLKHGVDKNASSNIRNDPKRGKRATERNIVHANGTKEARDFLRKKK